MAEEAGGARTKKKTLAKLGTMRCLLETFCRAPNAGAMPARHFVENFGYDSSLANATRL